MNKVLPPATGLIEFIANLLLGESPAARLAENVVVFPGKRPAHFLRKSLAGRIKAPFRPPVILSMDEFVDFACEKLAVPPGRKIEPIDAVDILYRILRTGPDDQDRRPWNSLDNFFPWGMKLFSDFEEIHIEKVDESRLKEIDFLAQEGLPTEFSRKISFLSRIYVSFYDALRKSNLSTRATRYRNLSERISELNTGGFSSVTFAGFFVFTKSETDILLELSKRENTNLLFQDGHGIKDTLASLGISVEQENGETRKPAVHFYKCTDPHSEVFALKNVLSERSGFSPADVVVAPLPETVFPMVEHVLPGLGTDYNISTGFPLSRTPVHALIGTLGTAIETRTPDKRYFVPAYLNLMLHPYVKNIYFNGKSYATRILFHTIEEYLGKRTEKFIHLEDIESNAELFRDICGRISGTVDGGALDEAEVADHLQKIHDIFLRPFEAIDSVGGFCGKILDCVSFVSKTSSANKHPYSSRFLKIVIEGLHKLGLSGLADNEMKSPGFFRLLSGYLGVMKYPFDGTPVKGLQVLGLLETRNLKFDTVYFLDCNEGVIPDTKKEDTILPYAMRRHLGLPTHEDREKISRHYFDLLTSVAGDVHIFYAEADDREMSRFATRLIWEEQKARKEIGKSSPPDIFFRVNFTQSDPAPVRKNGEMLDIIRRFTFSQSSLNTYLSCPLQFYHERVLGLRDKEEVSGDIDRMEIGSLVHDVLRRFYSTKTGRPLAAGKDDEEDMARHVRDVWRRYYGAGAGEGATYLIKRQVWNRMRDVLDYHSRNLSGITILECEPPAEDGKYLSHEGRVDIPGCGSIKIGGRFDRVDRRDGRIVVVDYKIGRTPKIPNSEKFPASPRENWPEDLKSVQLPFYVLLYCEENRLPVDQVDSSLMLLGGKEITEHLLFEGVGNGKARGELFREYREAIFTLIREILDPSLDFVATHDPETMCPRCHYAVICGRQWIARKY